MSEPIRRSRTDTFEHTIAGLLTKRSDLVAEALKVQEHLNSLREDIKAVDRILRMLGHTDDPSAAMPSARRVKAPFQHGELARMIFDMLRTAPEPMTTRQVAEETLVRRGEDGSDPEFMRLRIQAATRALRYFEQQGVLRIVGRARGKFLWALADAGAS